MKFMENTHWILIVMHEVAENSV